MKEFAVYERALGKYENVSCIVRELKVDRN